MNKRKLAILIPITVLSLALVYIFGAWSLNKYKIHTAKKGVAADVLEKPYLKNEALDPVFKLETTKITDIHSEEGKKQFKRNSEIIDAKIAALKPRMNELAKRFGDSP
jgi:hypothetical protein